MFSPPQISIPGSYSPSATKYLRSIANNPPAIVGDLIGFTKSSSFDKVPIKTKLNKHS